MFIAKPNPMKLLPSLRSFLVLYVVALCIPNLNLSCLAAEVSLREGRMAGAYFVSISGEIKKGDLDKVKAISQEAIQQGSELEFVLDSPGGDVEEAIEIGRFAREMLAGTFVYGTTFVLKDSDEATEIREVGGWSRKFVAEVEPDTAIDSELTKCYSACVLIFYGGTSKSVSSNNDYRFGFKGGKRYPVIGLHRPYFDQAKFATLTPKEAKEQYARLESEVRDYLHEMGAPNSVAERMFSAASHELDLVPDEEFAKFFQTKEPFLEEWIISRCGPPGPAGAFSTEELRDWKIRDSEMQALISGGKAKFKSLRDIDNFSTPSVAAERNLELLAKVNAHNKVWMACNFASVRKHQHDWAVAGAP
jgi:hypothetical protein